MQIDFLIVGQGVCGTFLSWELQKAGHTFMVIDEARPNSASKIASGIINPVTGRRIVKTWLIDELMPFARNAYKETGDWLEIQCIKEIAILDFFPSPQMRLAFLDRYTEDREFLTMPENAAEWNNHLRYDFGYGVISPSYLVDLPLLLDSFRKKLVEKQQLREAHFEQDHIEIKNNGIQYQDITARQVIFCDGIKSFENRWFKNLPFAPNKGEALIVEIRDLPLAQTGSSLQKILKKGVNIVPWRDELFWVGSSNEWNFKDDQPTPAFLERTTAQLAAFCKLPFTVVDHVAAIRPATVERRPFIGLHPLHPEIVIFNGMGTKGCSLAPFFARQLVDHLSRGVALSPEADVQRFRKVISRQ